MRSTLFFVLMTVSLAACMTVSGPRPEPVVPLPDDALGTIAGEWLAAINSGSADAIDRFVATRYSPGALAERSAAERVRALRNLQTESGGLELVSVIPATGQHPMSMLVRSRRGGRYARVVLGERNGTLLGLSVGPADPPDAERARRWPAGARSDAARVAAIRRELDRRAAEGSFSGVLLVARGDTVLLHEARGWADRESRVANTTDTAFHLASVGKLFTAAAIGKLIDDGRLTFDTTVAEVLPDYPNAGIARKITIHHLLTHTSGLGTFFGSPGYVADRRYASGFEQLAVFRDEPLFFEPGTQWRYSNAGFAVLEAIIERVSGESFETYLRRTIFEPQRIAWTSLDPSRASAPSVSTFYSPAEDDPFGTAAPVADHTLKSRVPTGYGEGYSTAADLFRFTRALRAGRIVTDGTLQAMLGAKVEIGRGGERNLRGLRERTVHGQTVRGHTGGGRADVVMLWESDYTVIVLTNLSPPSASAFGAEITEFLARSLSE